MKTPAIFFVLLVASLSGWAQSATRMAAHAINALGIDLLHQTSTPDANALLSPYSIQMAMAMTCAGAEGQTREEMQRVLHYPRDQATVNAAFGTLQADLDRVMQAEAAREQELEKYGDTNQPLTLTTANRLFGQVGYDFRPAYLSLLQDTYLAPLETWDFIHDAPGGITHINAWVAGQTHDRIPNLIPPRALTRDTRLVLVNAIYLKAAWQNKFEESATEPRPFNLPGGTVAPVPTMFQQDSFPYARRDGCQVVVLPYQGGELQLVIVLPDATNGLAVVEAGLTPERLAAYAGLPSQKVRVYLPKFKLEPAGMSLRGAFQSLGLKSAFDLPHGSANFDGMAPRRKDDYLYISDILHQTFLKLDESGTEAAAATAVMMFGASAVMMPAAPPPEIHVDHPFLLAIQDRASGACLFLGHVADPR